MRRYETIVIVDPDAGEDGRTSLFARIKEIIPQQEGVLITEDTWGIKKLAYEIKKKPRGFYVRYDYCGMGPVVDEMERFFRIDDRVLKYMTVLLAEEADPEAILAEMQSEEASDEDAAAKSDAQAPKSEEAPAVKAEDAPKEEAAQEAETATDKEGKE